MRGNGLEECEGREGDRGERAVGLDVEFLRMGEVVDCGDKKSV